jgi:two-component system, chemotaxis family, response regulator Rcp1
MKTEVLLVDDNPGDAELVASLLTASGREIEVHSVVDGVEAMAFLRSEGRYSGSLLPHLIFLDLNMPRKDGWSVLHDIKSDLAFKDVPVLVFTTSQAHSDIARCHKLGANSYVSKPADLKGYTTAIAAIGNYWFGTASLPRELT